MPRTRKQSAFWLLIPIAIGLATYVLFGSAILARFGGYFDRLPDELQDDALRQLGSVEDRRLTEISGIDLSLNHPGAAWVHNDSGNAAELYLISLEGKTLATVVLEGATNIDWEDLCVFDLWGNNYICVADVGDNSGRRESCQLYVLKEPKLDPDFASSEQSNGRDSDTAEMEAPEPKLPPETVIRLKPAQYRRLDFKYRDGPKNCEAIGFDNTVKSFWLCQKRLDRDKSLRSVGLYRLQIDSKFNLLRKGLAYKLAEIPNLSVTGMDFSSDGRQLMLGDYVSGVRIRRPIGSDWRSAILAGEHERFPLPAQRQGEAICFSADDSRAICTSEFTRQPIWSVKIDAVLDQGEE